MGLSDAIERLIRGAEPPGENGIHVSAVLPPRGAVPTPPSSSPAPADAGATPTEPAPPAAEPPKPMPDPLGARGGPVIPPVEPWSPVAPPAAAPEDDLALDARGDASRLPADEAPAAPAEQGLETPRREAAAHAVISPPAPPDWTALLAGRATAFPDETGSAPLRRLDTADLPPAPAEPGRGAMPDADAPRDMDADRWSPAVTDDVVAEVAAPVELKPPLGERPVAEPVPDDAVLDDAPEADVGIVPPVEAVPGDGGADVTRDTLARHDHDPAGTTAPTASVPSLPAAQSAALTDLETAATIVEALGLGYHLGSAVERIVVSEARGPADEVPTLREAIWLIERHIEIAEADAAAETLDAIRSRLARNGEVIAGLQALSAAVDARRTGRPARGLPGPPTSDPGAGRQPASPALEPSPVAEADRVPAGDPPPAATGPRSFLAPDDPDGYSLGRELIVMAVRFGLILVVLVVVILVATLAAGWR